MPGNGPQMLCAACDKLDLSRGQNGDLTRAGAGSGCKEGSTTRNDTIARQQGFFLSDTDRKRSAKAGWAPV